VSRPGHRLLVALVGAAVLSTAACTGGSSDDGQKPTGTTVTAPPPFTGVQSKLPRGKALSNDPDLYQNVALTGCKKSGGGWQASGTAKNTGNEDIEFEVVVFFTDAQARTVDWARAKVSVGADSTEAWRVERPLDGLTDARCVVRAVSSAS